MTTIYLHRFQVRGAGIVPFDMLRYDCCFPNSEGEDSAKLEAATFPGGKREAYVVTLCRWSDRRDWQPTADRWRSFGWQVVDGSHEVRP